MSTSESEAEQRYQDALERLAVLNAVVRAHHEARHCGVVPHRPVLSAGGHAYVTVRAELTDAECDYVNIRKRDYLCESEVT
jgi:hypothetical protein